MSQGSHLKALLLSSTLILTGCGDRDSSSESSSATPFPTANQAKLTEIQADLASMQMQSGQLGLLLAYFNYKIKDVNEDIELLNDLIGIQESRIDSLQWLYDSAVKRLDYLRTAELSAQIEREKAELEQKKLSLNKLNKGRFSLNKKNLR